MGDNLRSAVFQDSAIDEIQGTLSRVANHEQGGKVQFVFPVESNTPGSMRVLNWTIVGKSTTLFNEGISTPYAFIYSLLPNGVVVNKATLELFIGGTDYTDNVGANSTRNALDLQVLFGDASTIQPFSDTKSIDTYLYYNRQTGNKYQTQVYPGDYYGANHDITRLLQASPATSGTYNGGDGIPLISPSATPPRSTYYLAEIPPSYFTFIVPQMIRIGTTNTTDEYLSIITGSLTINGYVKNRE